MKRKRRYRRRTVRVSVEYVSDVCGPRRELATTLGAGGLFIRCEEPLPRGTLLRMSFRLPGSECLHQIEGRVVWNHAADPGDEHVPGMGIQFADRCAAVRLARDLEAMD